MSGTELEPRPDASRIDPAVYLRERYEREGLRGPARRSYYALKPLMPRRLQLGARRLYARRQALRGFPAWPIEPLLVEHEHGQLRRRLEACGVERLPVVNYWPDRHRFASVLTHDVETNAGIRNIDKLLEVERRHGFVSAWYFVAEDYAIPAGTFERIRAAGGEVGLHGIHHDGKLFSSRRAFEAELDKIRHYLDAWDAVGFRSPGTLRNPDWMPEIGCLYDTSFPDTDPFQPQPGGCCSIFPYFLDDLVEVPITLAQDHTLWEILRIRSIDLWRKKADWLVDNHGLVNVIVHPDYVRTPDRLDLYEQLLRHLRRRIDGDDGWHALPREVASWWRTRAALRVKDGEGGPWIAGDADGHGQRATVAWARELAGSMTIDV